MQNPSLQNEKLATSTLRSGRRLLALDIGSKRVGVAVSDELHITTRPLPCLLRTNWKQLLKSVQSLCRDYDVQALVIGLPLHLNGSESIASEAVRHLARNFALSLRIPVFLQDERLTSHEAESQLRSAPNSKADYSQADSIAASIILKDFVSEQIHTPTSSIQNRLTHLESL